MGRGVEGANIGDGLNKHTVTAGNELCHGGAVRWAATEKRPHDALEDSYLAACGRV